MLRSYSLLTLALPLAAQTPIDTVRLEGHVVDVRGDPIPVAAIVVSPANRPDITLAKGTTDGDGQFVLGKVPTHTAWCIRASAPGRTPTTAATTDPTQPVTIALPEAVRVVGTLRDRAHRPVPDVTVIATLASTRHFGGALDADVTDADGRFVLGNAPLGNSWITAVIPGENLVAMHANVTADCTIDLDFGPPNWPVKNALFEVAGLPSDGPPPEATFHIRPYGGVYPAFPPPWNRMPIDARGRAELPGMPMWACTVTPEIPGYVCQPDHARLEGGESQLRFTALPTGAATEWSGVVRDERDQPTAGVVLEFRGLDGQRLATATTDATGRWQQRVPLPGGSDVVVRCATEGMVVSPAPDAPSVTPYPTVDVPAKLRTDAPLALRAERMEELAGRVVLADGTSPGRVPVQLEYLMPGRLPYWSPLALTSTRADGRYRLRLQPTRGCALRIGVRSALGVGAHEVRMEAPRGEAVVLPDLVLLAPSTVEGVAKDAAGTPMTGHRVAMVLRPSPSNLPGFEPNEVLTDRFGRFRFVGVPPGVATLRMPSFSMDANKSVAGPFEITTGSTSTFVVTPPK